MPINYGVKKTTNPNGEPEVDYFHAKAIKSNDFTFEELAKEVNNSTTVTQADALAVLKAIKAPIISALLSGRAVVLNDLGRLQIGLRGKCYTAEEMQAKNFNPASKILGHRICFRPESKLKKEVAIGFSLNRVSTEAMK